MYGHVVLTALKWKPSKCHRAKGQVKYLRHIFEKGIYRPNLEFSSCARPGADGGSYSRATLTLLLSPLLFVASYGGAETTVQLHIKR